MADEDKARHPLEAEDVIEVGPLPTLESAGDSIARPPSFSESQFATIVRRQRRRRIVSPTMERLEESRTAPPLPEVLSFSTQQSPSAARRRHQHHHLDPSPDTHMNAVVEETTRQSKQMRSDSDKTCKGNNSWHSWPFAGWGSMMMLELSRHELEESQARLNSGPQPALEWARAASIAGNALTGSVFYSIPAVLAACAIFTPLSLLLAIVLLWPFRPIMCQLAQTFQNGDASSYTYLLNIVHRSWFALVVASFILLDAVATGAVSAATAASYIYKEASPAALSPLDTFLGGAGVVVVLLAAMALIALLGLRSSASIAVGMISIHLLTMVALIIAGIVQWTREGNATLVSNWREAIPLLSQGRGIARSIFDGTCTAFVGLTGFEMAPTYVQSVKDGHFSIALRNLHLVILVTEVPLALLVVVLIPLDAGLNAPNVLAVLAQVCSSSTPDGPSSWLKIIVVVDAAIVLMGGIITGLQATCGLCQSLAYDGILSPIFLARMPRTQASFMSIGLFFALSILFCAAFQFDMAMMSSVFSLTFLFVMTSFPLSLLLLKWYRPKLEETGGAARAQVGLACVASALAIGITAVAGNAALTPVYLLKTAALALGFFVAMWALKKRAEFARSLLWLSEERWWGSLDKRPRTARSVKGIHQTLARWMTKERTRPVVFVTHTDEISQLVNVMRYIDEVSQPGGRVDTWDADRSCVFCRTRQHHGLS